MYYLGYDYKACLELLNDHHVYIDLENKKENIAFVRDDVYYYKIQVYHKLEKFQEIIDLLDNLEKENDFFKHKSEYVDLINYFRAVSYYKLRKEKDENENRQKVYLNNSLKTLDKITNKKSEIYIDSLIYRIDFNHYLFNIYLNCYLKERKNKLELEKLIENFDNYVKDLDEVITDDMIEKSRLNRIWEYKLFGLFYFNKYSFSELDHFIKSNKDYEKYYVNNDKNRNFVESFYLGLAYFRDEINFFDIFFKKKSKPGISYQENLKKCQNFLDKYKYEIEVNEKNKHLITINKINLHFCRGVLGILNKNYQDLKDFDRAFEISERDFNSSSYYSSEYLIFDKRFELSYYKSIALLKHKDLISAQKNIKKAYDFLSEDLKIDEKLRESIQFINSYIGYKIEKDKNENSYKFDVGLENFEYLKNEVNFYKGKCFLKNQNLKESLEHFNSIKEKDPFWRAHVLIKHKVECNYKYGIYNQINEKKHGQKNEHLENTIALIEKNKEKLIEQNNSYKNKNENKNKEVNYDLYKAKCLYYLDNKDDLLYDFVVNSNLQINNDLVSRDLDFLKGVAIMRYKIKTNEMFHYKMINVKQSYIQNSSSAEIKEYIANLDEAKTHLANFLRNQANQNKTDKELEKYDISTIEKVHTAKFYLAIIYQHKCSNNIINSLNHFAEIYRDKVNDVENFGYKNESKISKNRDEIINILSDLFSKLSENETKMNSLNFREFNKTDFCFYFGLALFKSKLYIDNQHSEKLFKMAIAEANTDLSKKMYSILSNFFLGLIYYKSGSFQNAKDCFNQSTSSFILTKFYLQCCEYKIELKKNNGILAEVEIAKMEQIYNSVRNILLEITEINGLENFSEKNLDELLEIMISCFFEIFKNSNEKKNLADNFKQSLEQCKISEDIKIKAIEKYSDRINVLDYYSFNKTKTDLEKFLKNISQKVDTIEKNYYIGIANFKLYEKENDFNFLRESEKHLTAYFSNYSTDKTKINLLLNAKFYLIKCSFERDQYEDLENIEKNLDYINQYWSAKNDDEKYLIDFDENLKNYYLIKTCFYRKNYSQAYQLLLDYTKSEDNLTDEIKYIFNVCLVELNKCNQKSQEQSKEKSEKFDINKSSQYYDNNQIHLAHEYFKLNDSQNCYNLSHGIFNKFFHNSATQKLKNKFVYEKYEYYLLISCMINSYFHLAIQKNDQNAFTAISDYCEKAIKYHEYNKIEYFKSVIKENIFKKLYLSKYFSKDYDFLIGLNEDSFSCLAEYNYLKGASFFKKFTHKSEAKSHLKKYIDSYKLNKIIDTRVNVLNAYYFLTLINFEESVNENEPLNYIINETKSVLSEDGKDLRKALKKENPKESILEFDMNEIYYYLGVYYFQNLNFQLCLDYLDKVDKYEKINPNSVLLYKSVCFYELGDENNKLKAIDLMRKIDLNFEYYANSVLYLGLIYFDLGDYEKSFDTLFKLNDDFKLNKIKNLFNYHNDAEQNQFYLYEKFIVKSARKSAFKTKANNYINNDKFEVLKQISSELIEMNKPLPKLNCYNFINFGWSLNFLEDYSGVIEFFEDMKKNEIFKYNKILKSKVKDDFYFILGVALFKKSSSKSIYKNLLNNRNSFNQNELLQSKSFLELANKNLNHDPKSIGKEDELIIWNEKKLFINFYLSMIYSSEGDFENAFSCLKTAYDFYFSDFLKNKNQNSSGLRINIKLDDIEIYNPENLHKIFNNDLITTEIENHERDIYYDILFFLFNIVFKNYDKNLAGINFEKNLKKFSTVVDDIFSNMDKFNLTSRLNFVELVYFYKFKLMFEISQLKKPDLKKSDNQFDQTPNENEKNSIIEKLLNSRIMEKSFDESCCFYFDTYYFLSLHYSKDKSGRDYDCIKKLINSLQNNSNLIKKESLVEKIYILYIEIFHDYINSSKLTDEEINDCLVKLKNFKENYSYVFKYEQTEWEKYKIESLKSKTKYLMKNNTFERLQNDFENLIKNTFYKNLEIKKDFEEAELKINSKQNKIDPNEGVIILAKLYESKFKTLNYKNENDDFKTMKFKIVNYLTKSKFENKAYEECKRLFNENRLFLFEIIEKASLVPMIYFVCISIINTENDWSKVEELVEYLNEDNVIDKFPDLKLNFILLRASLLYKKLDYASLVDMPKINFPLSANLNEEYELYKFAAGYWIEFEKLYKKPEEFLESLNNNSIKGSIISFFQLFAGIESGKSNLNLNNELKNVFKNIEESKKNVSNDELNLAYYRNNIDYDLIKGLFLFIEKNYTESLKHLNSYTQFLDGGKKEYLSIYPGLIVNYYKLICVNKINEDLKKELEKNLAKNKYAEIRNSLEQNMDYFNQIEIYFNDKILDYIEKSNIKKNVFDEMANFYFSAENYAKFIEISKRIDKKNDKLNFKLAVSNYKILELNDTERLEEIRNTLYSILSKNKFSELYYHLFNINLLLKNYAESLRNLNEMTPKPFDYEFNCGLIFFEQKKYQEAQNAFEKQIKASNQTHLESYLYLLLCEKSRNENKSLCEIYENENDSKKLLEVIKKCDKALFCSNWKEKLPELVKDRKNLFQTFLKLKKEQYYKSKQDLKFYVYIPGFWRNQEYVQCIQKALEDLGFEFSISDDQNSVLKNDGIDEEFNSSYFILLFLSKDYLEKSAQNANLKQELDKMQEKIAQKKLFCSVLFEDLNSFKWPASIQNLKKYVGSNLCLDFKTINNFSVNKEKNIVFKKFCFFSLIETLINSFERF